MWSVTFFSTDPLSPIAAGKSRKGTNTWHVMVSLLESSLPTFFDSQLVVAVPSPVVPKSIQTPRLREARSTTFPSSGDKQHQSQSSVYDYNYDGKPYSRSSRSHNALAPSEEDRYPSSSSPKLPPPTHPLRGLPSSPRSSTATPPPITIRLGSGNHKLEAADPPGTHLNSAHSRSRIKLLCRTHREPDNEPRHMVGSGCGLYESSHVLPRRGPCVSVAE